MTKTIRQKVLISSSIVFFLLAPILTYFFTGPLSHFQCQIQQPENGWCELGTGFITGPIIFLSTAALGGVCLFMAFRKKRLL